MEQGRYHFILAGCTGPRRSEHRVITRREKRRDGAGGHANNGRQKVTADRTSIALDFVGQFIDVVGSSGEMFDEQVTGLADRMGDSVGPGGPLEMISHLGR